VGNVLITGGAGYIGSHAVHAFLDAGHRAVVLDNLSTGVRDNLPADVPFYHGDIGDAGLVARIVAEHGIDGILHFAGSIVVPESVSDPLKYYRNNVARGLELLCAAVEARVPAFIFSSTAAVYGIPEGPGLTEASPTRPINPYGWSKLMFEQQLRDVAAAHGFSAGVLRYFNVAGADPRGRTGQSTPNATHLIKVACEVATGKRPEMSVFGTDYATPDGTCIRDYIHVSDLADVHVALYERLASGGAGGTWNCGNGRGYSVREVIAAVERAAGRPLKVREAGRRPGDPDALVADPSLVFETLPWRPRHDLAAMVETALAWESRGRRSNAA